MKKIYVKIEGMTCDHCKLKITKALEKINNIESIIFDGHIAEISYANKINKKKIVSYITNIDYYTNLKMISEDEKILKRSMSFSELIKIVGILVLVSVLLNKIFGFNIFNMIPVIDSKTTYAMLFATGLLTSIHCISMCGAINLAASSSSTRNYKKPILYNLGRLTSYTLLGGIIGLLGSAFKINAYVQGTIIIIAAVFMFLMALNMMGMINFSIKLKLPKTLNKLKSKGSFMIGLLNGLMPCGPLQSMQIYALSTGSFFYGALSMFLFCLGTIPLMLFVGMLSNFLTNNYRKMLNKVSTVLILVLSLAMLNRGFLSMGIDISNIFKPNYDNYLKSEIIDDYQVIEFDLSYGGYQDIIVQKDIPIKMIINASNNSLTGCNNGIKINAFDIERDILLGENIIEFTADKTGIYTYTCWMGMLKNNIVVVDDISLFNNINNQ
ncbi:MAG: sulfite exporter TauE/SafE family protein [Bacilli bacterium]|nr:sulfite exporter TauE/SafE family protein [Bacilli bacterium]